MVLCVTQIVSYLSFFLYLLQFLYLVLEYFFLYLENPAFVILYS